MGGRGFTQTIFRGCFDYLHTGFSSGEKSSEWSIAFGRHDGEYRWIFGIGVPRFNQERVFRWLQSDRGVDVTERRHVDKAVHESEERFSPGGSGRENVCL